MIGLRSEKELHLRVTKKFISSFHGINAIFSRAHAKVTYRLFKTYCMDLYGCNFWNLAGSDALSFFILWRKCIHKLLYLSPMTHSRFLPLLCDDIPIELQLFRRFNKFLWNVSKSYNPCVSMCYKLVINGSNSVFCKNVNTISQHLNIAKSKIGTSTAHFFKISESYINKTYGVDDFVRCGNIKDLLYICDYKCIKLELNKIN